MSLWSRWIRQPQDVLFRRMIFQVHLWTGLILGLYILMICVTGSILVYRVEISQNFGPKPVFVEGSGQALSEEALRNAALQAHPGYTVADIRIGEKPNQAVEVTLERNEGFMQRLIHPFTGEDLGYAQSFIYRSMEWILVLHDTLRLGITGRMLNALGGSLLALLALTGTVIWWPGSRKWRGSLTIDGRANWKRMTWTIHSSLGFWFLLFILMWGISGLYLSYSEPFVNLADYFEPPENYEPETRISDRIMYWLAYLHFGRFGRRLPGCAATCDSTLKAVWSFVGLVPAIMFVTGAIMWWNRVLRPASRRAESVIRQGGMQPAEK